MRDEEVGRVFIGFGLTIFLFAGIKWFWSAPQNQELIRAIGSKLFTGVSVLALGAGVGVILIWIALQIPGMVDEEPEK